MHIPFNINILNQLLNQYPDKANKVKDKFPKIDDWKKETAHPTLLQLSGLADFFHIPFGYFFLNDMPVKEYPIPHYRTINNITPFKPSQELLDTIEILEQRQEWAKIILKDIKSEPLYFADTVTIDGDIEQTAQTIRDILNVSEGWAKHETFKSWNEAFKFLVSRIEKAGVYVIINGIVGNATIHQLNIDEFRGFVLYDEYAPFIFINNKDYVSGKIFTIIHELVHILLGKSASFDYLDLQPANTKIEEFCDSVTAEFLVSKNSLLANFAQVGKDYQKLASIYKVSQIVIARRLYDLGKISYSEFVTDLNSFKYYRTEKTSLSDTKQGDFYNNQPNRISRNFFDLVFKALKQNKVLYRDAFRLTGLTPKTFDGYVEKYITHKN